MFTFVAVTKFERAIPARLNDRGVDGGCLLELLAMRAIETHAHLPATAAVIKSEASPFVRPWRIGRIGIRQRRNAPN